MKFGLIYEICRPDPEWATEADTYRQALEQCVVAEEVGFDHVWAVEHHFLENYSLSAAPDVFLSAVAQRTERIRIGHGVRLLPPPFNHPARSASSAAVLDILSEGRLEFGVGRSITEQELGGFGINPADSRPMLEEVLPEIVKMWTNHTYPGHSGVHFSMPPRVVQPKPLQSPHPPLWMACTQPSSFELAADFGAGALAFGLGLPGDLAEAVRVYKARVASPRRQAGVFVNDNIAAAGMMFCADDDDKARSMGGAAQLWYAANAAALFAPWAAREEPGYEYYHQLAKDPSLFEAAALRQRLDDGLSLVGTPDKVADGVRRYEELGVDQLICIVQVGRVTHKDICDSLRLFGDQVIPRFRSVAQVGVGVMREAPEFAFNLWDSAVKADPYPLYAEMRAAGRVIANPFLAGQLMVPGYDDVIALLSDPETFSNGRLSGPTSESVFLAPTMLNSDPPDHERLRSVVARAFTPRSVNALEDRMREVARDLVAPLFDGAVFDVVDELAERLPVLVIADLLGVGTADLENFVEWSHGLLGTLDLFAPPEKAQLAQASSKLLHDYFAEEVARRRDRPTGDDLIGRLVAANADGRLSEAEMLSSCVLLLLGGNETTTRLIANAALALHRHLGERARLASDPSLLPTAVDEVLRYDTPVQGNGRITTRAVEFAGVDIPTGTLVIGLLAAANRDPDHFDDPDRFDVGRTPNPHLAFSRGIHFCLGANLARLEARAAIGELLRAAPDYELAEPSSSLEYGPTFFFHSPTHLMIKRGS